MRTTVRLPDDLHAQVRSAAVAQGATVTAFIEEALRLALAGCERVERSGAYRVHPLPAGRGLQPGVDLDDHAGLADLMDDAAHAAVAIEHGATMMPTTATSRSSPA